ncbi:MAG: hypothetical protein DRO15_00010 [Thermoprotei archaeon]|nr:MAG: hypothetical protein DRO15_00010 [Thermoprotei archaeon]
MKLRLDCVVCIAKQALKAARLATNDPKVQEEVLRRVMHHLTEMEWVGTPSQLVRESRVAELIGELTGVDDPYRDLKRASNDEALAMVVEVKSLIASLEDSLRAAVKVAIAGNITDFAAVEAYDLRATIEKVMKQEPAIDDYSRLRREVLSAETLLYFADNAGEIVFDKLLIEEMIRVKGKPFRRVSFVVKGGPTINDATIEDALYVGLDKLPNIEFRKVSSGKPSTGPELFSPEVLSWIRNHDLVISKGQGNYEDLSDVGGVYFLLMAKCPVVAEDIGVKVGDIVIKRG